MEKKLIIFGCGYLGTELAKKAIEQGWEVSALTRNKEAAEALRSLGLKKIVVGLLQDTKWHKELEPRAHAVVNCVSAANSGLDGYRLSYVEGQKSIIQWAERGEVHNYVYTSSTGVYPQGGGVDVNEEASIENVKPKGLILLQAEDLVRRSTCFKRWFILRLSGIYGPGRHYLLDQLRRGDRIISGDPGLILNNIYRGDAVSAILTAINAPGVVGNRLYNLSSGEKITKKMLVDYLMSLLSIETLGWEPTMGGKAVMPSRYIVSQKIREELVWFPYYQDIRACYKDILLKM